MTRNTLPRLLMIAAVLGLSACSAEKAFDNTVDGTLWVGKTAVKVGAGAVKLGAKGTAAAVRKVTETE